DTLTWTKMMSLSLGLNMTREMLRTRLVTELGEPGKQIAHRLVPPYPEDAPFIIQELPPPADEVTEAHRERGEAFGEAFVPQFGLPAPGIGSNSWVVAGSRTASGKPILANDTHLGLGLPSAWYEIGLHGGRFDVVGFSFPSMPAVVTGHNGRIAWGITSLATDVQDLFLEKLDDPEQPKRYQFMDEWRDLEIIHETIEVKGGEPVSFDLQVTHHGPIINAAFDNIADEPPMAMSWTALGGVPLMQAFIGVDLARDWQDFRQALSFFDAPSLSFTYADVDGNIGYQAVGKHPLRSVGHDGTVPVPGWSGEYEWQGFIPFDEMPREFNPERGYVVTANNKVVSDDYPYHLAYDWAGPERARRITDLVSAAEGIDLEGMGKIQGDSYSVQAEDLRPYLLAAAADDLNDLETRARAEVENWDLVYETDRVGGAVYFVWQWFLFRNIMGDELGEELTDEMVIRSFAEKNVLADLMAWSENPWFDDTATPEVETRDDMVRRSLTGAVAWLVERYGEDPAAWQWGRLHTMTFAHQPLGQAGIGPVDRIFNSTTFPARGGPSTVNAALASLARPFVMVVGPSQRFLADLSDLNRSLSVNSTGQCAHTFHAHREDQIALWANVEFHPVLFDPQQVEAEAEAVLTINPQ
ncbi:MAG: penicillin acylase family protein, partial [bacterium]|nr:penicillin acylase family protein [bacterium]